MDEVERFDVILCSTTVECRFVNEARKKLFATRRHIENIPPTQDAHTKVAIYRGIYIWNRTLMPQHDVPSSVSWGWKRKEDEWWILIWPTLPEVSKSCKELVKCSCKNLIDLDADIVKPPCLVLSCVSA